MSQRRSNDRRKNKKIPKYLQEPEKPKAEVLETIEHVGPIVTCKCCGNITGNYVYEIIVELEVPVCTECRKWRSVIVKNTTRNVGN